MGGEGDNESERSKLRKQMADFGHINYHVRKETENKTLKNVAPDCKKAIAQARNKVYITCRNDVAALLQLAHSMGAFNNPKLKTALMDIKKRYKL